MVVGADRVVANGDTANKIGTYALSIIAAHHKVGMIKVYWRIGVRPGKCFIIVGLHFHKQPKAANLIKRATLNLKLSWNV